MTSRNLHEEAEHLKNLSYVANTEKNTTKWLRHLMKIDGKLFKVKSINNYYAALARYLRENSSIPDEDYGDTDKSDSLTSNEIEKNNQDCVFYRQRYGHTNTRSIPILADNPKNQFIPNALENNQ
ncbi:26920_t:CDS:2, partial [Racocetra persica]